MNILNPSNNNPTPESNEAPLQYSGMAKEMKQVVKEYPVNTIDAEIAPINTDKTVYHIYIRSKDPQFKLILDIHLHLHPAQKYTEEEFRIGFDTLETTDSGLPLEEAVTKAQYFVQQLKDPSFVHNLYNKYQAILEFEEFLQIGEKPPAEQYVLARKIATKFNSPEEYLQRQETIEEYKRELEKLIPATHY